MRRLVCCLVIILSLSFSSVCYASSNSQDDLIMLAKSYESNLVNLICGNAWEMPLVDSEFTPSEPLGEYVFEEPSEDLLLRYNTWLDLSIQSGFLDSGVSSEDVDSCKLTKGELVKLSDVEFEYYIDYSNEEVIQWYNIYWVDSSISRGYLVWGSSGLITEVGMY